MHATLVAGLLLASHPGAAADTGRACFEGARDPLGPELCLEAARDTAFRRLDRIVARVLDGLSERERIAFDSASEAWGIYMNAECTLPYNRVPRSPAADSARLAFRTVVACHARLTDERAQLLREAYNVDTLAPPRPTTCLRFEPEVVTLTGKLERHTFSGLPNYESIARGDQPETGLYLRPVRPICVTGNLSEFNNAVGAVRLVQLLPDDAQYPVLRRQIGHRVTVRGTLFEPGTMHWHAPLGLDMRKPASHR